MAKVRRSLFPLVALVCFFNGLASPRAAESDVLQAVVGLLASVPENARTADTLGTERIGSGVLIDDEGLVLTIGYLVTEAEDITIVTVDGKRARARLHAYDYESGLALLRTAAKPDVKPMRFGDSSKLGEHAAVLAVSFGGERPVTSAQVVSVRPFAGYWEYLLERAIFTAPPHPLHSGAALVGEDGRLYGIGSLFVGDAIAPRMPFPGNMFVPIDDLKPVLADLLDKGKRATPPRPWLGINSQEVGGRIVVTRVTPESPAAKAGLVEGDLVLGVGGKPVGGLAQFYRELWASGPAGTPLMLNVLPRESSDFQVRERSVRGVDRSEWLKSGRSF